MEIWHAPYGSQSGAPLLGLNLVIWGTPSGRQSREYHLRANLWWAHLGTNVKRHNWKLILGLHLESNLVCPYLGTNLGHHNLEANTMVNLGHTI